jgi:hypothetical protein
MEVAVMSSLAQEEGDTCASKHTGATAMDRRLTAEDIDWLRKLRNARAANQPSPDIPTSVVRKLTLLAYAELKSLREHPLKLRDRDELDRRKQSS